MSSQSQQDYEDQHRQQQQEQEKDKDMGSENGVREFGCPCGKTYLSYPALYTHVKTKHDGKPPGTLIKPKHQKNRGRPKTILVDAPLDDSQCPFDLKEQIERTLTNIDLNYQQNFETSQGDSSCQDMASKFLEQLQNIDDNELKLKYLIVKKYGQSYWRQHEPNQIIDAANQFYHTHETIKQKYPLDKKIFIDLTFLLFKWMYRNKWTNHKLIKRNNHTTMVISK